MADKLPCAFREVLEKIPENGLVQVTSGGDPDGSIGGCKEAVVQIESGVEARFEPVEEANLHLSVARARGSTKAPGRFERISNSGHRGLSGGVEERPAYGGKKVGVLMCIEMRYR